MFNLLGHRIDTSGIIILLAILLVAEYVFIIKNWVFLTEMGVSNPKFAALTLSALQIIGVVLWVVFSS